MATNGVGAQRAEIGESIDLAEAADELEFHMDNVWKATSRLKRGAKFGVVGPTLASVDELHLDVRMSRLE